VVEEQRDSEVMMMMMMMTWQKQWLLRNSIVLCTYFVLCPLSAVITDEKEEKIKQDRSSLSFLNGNMVKSECYSKLFLQTQMHTA
jgi:hypothetical protein